MPEARVKPVGRHSEDHLGRPTYRHPGNLFAGTVGGAGFVIAAIRDAEGGMRAVFAVIALVLFWLGWMCRMTITQDGLVVQNYGRPHLVPWRDITAVHMAKMRSEDVLHLELRGRRTVQVWAVAAGLRAGG